MTGRHVSLSIQLLTHPREHIKRRRLPQFSTKGSNIQMPSKIQIILVPYDSGHRNLRMGAGPEHFVNNGLAQVLEADGHEVFVETIEAQSDFQAEVKTQFGLYRSLAEHVAEAKRNGR